MLFAFVYSLLRLLLDVADVRLRVRDPEAELLLLRHQLRVVRRQVKRPRLDVADRTIMAALSHRVSRAAWVGMLVQPGTVLGWHRELVRRKWAAFGRRRGPSRPGLHPELQTLILEMAKDNPKWGLRPHPWRVAQARSGGFRNCDPQVAAPEPDRSGTVALATELEGVLASPGSGHRPHRLPERGYRAVGASLRPPTYGAGYQEGDLVCGHRSAGRDLGESVGEERLLGTQRGRSRRSVPGPRSRRQVWWRLGSCLPGGRHRGDQDADCGAQGQRPHRAADWFDPTRVSGLDPAADQI